MSTPRLAGSPDRLLDAGEIASLLNVPESWVRREAREGNLPCLHLGHYRRFEWSAVIEWLKTRREGEWRKYHPGAGRAA